MTNPIVFNEYIRRKDGVYITVNIPGSTSEDTEMLQFTIDGGGAPITTGVKGDIQANFTGTLNSVTLLADQVGDIKIDIWKDTYAHYPPTNGDSITGGNEPEISSANKYSDATLSGWTTDVTQGDIFRFNVDSVATIERVQVSLSATRTVDRFGLFFTAYHPMEVMWISETHTSAGTDSSAVTLDIERLQDTDAPGAGQSVITTPFDLKGTINTPQERSGRTLSDYRVLSPLDRLATVVSGDLTGVAGIQITCYLKFSGRGDYY